LQSVPIIVKQALRRNASIAQSLRDFVRRTRASDLRLTRFIFVRDQDVAKTALQVDVARTIVCNVSLQTVARSIEALREPPLHRLQVLWSDPHQLGSSRLCL
jgi:hypothetical protein